MKQISIFILADQAISREGLRNLIQAASDLDVIVTGDAESLDAALEGLARSRPDAVILALPLPICALNATRRILSLVPAVHVVVLSRHLEDPRYADLIVGELKQAGASAVLPKNTGIDELRNALQSAMAGTPVFRARSGAAPEGPDRPTGVTTLSHPSLTMRQTQVLTLVAEGLPTKEIADRLSISPKTVEKHRQSVKEKLRTNNAADLARRAIGLGLVQAA